MTGLYPKVGKQFIDVFHRTIEGEEFNGSIWQQDEKLIFQFFKDARGTTFPIDIIYRKNMEEILLIAISRTRRNPSLITGGAEV